MGFLHKLWDETLAGPPPDSGLGKLRKYNSFSASRSAPPHDDLIPVSRSITVVRRDGACNLSVAVDSPSLPSSPVGSSGPNSPFSPNSPGGNFKKWMRRKPAKGALHNSHAESKNGFDWVLMLNSLDR
ncbi:hypothetical protein ACS0TY_035481 [Phlomoides rotata]